MKKDIALLKEDVNKLKRRVRELEKDKEKPITTATTKSVTQIEFQPTSTGKVGTQSATETLTPVIITESGSLSLYNGLTKEVLVDSIALQDLPYHAVSILLLKLFQLNT